VTVHRAIPEGLPALGGNGPPAILELIRAALPRARVLRVIPLSADTDGSDEATEKAMGYGAPLRITVANPDGSRRDLVLHTATADEFGHDRRADRAANMLLAFDSFDRIPHHVAAVDVGAVTAGGHFRSLRDTGEFYLLTSYAEGRVYAEDLRRIARTGALAEGDVARAARLARILARIHSERPEGHHRYRRAIRDLIGHGEGIFGIIDGYPAGVEEASPERLAAIERRVLEWRFKLRTCERRLARTHGDFHPFNVVVGEGDEITLLDTSRGSEGDPADDVTCMAINYFFFALQAPGTWQTSFRLLWSTFLQTYLDETGDHGILDVAAPFFAWRGLVLASPRWYPAIAGRTRNAILSFVERVLEAPRFHPDDVEELLP
jgi:hypothetical protein